MAKKTRKRSVGRAGLVFVGAGLLLGGAWWWQGATDRRPSAPANVLLITIDTLRADALGSHGRAAAATPWMDRLAAGGVRFAHARAHNVVTLPSHANILTGRLPPDHGVHDNSGFRLPAREETLATWLKARGFRTAAFVSAFPLDSRFGLDRGFDVYDDRFVDATPRPAMLEQERAGPDTVSAARRWLDAQDGAAPWFCWVHLYEPHFPYAPPEPLASRFAAAPYAGEVAAVDAALGPLLRPFLEAGDARRTLVVVTSDHGESLGEHGEATHGIFAYEATLRVPLIFYYPPLLDARTSDVAAGHVDILPTILDLLRLPRPPAIRGRAVAGPAAADDGAAAVTYFEALSGSLNRGWAPLRGVVARDLKFIDLPLPELYDLRADAAEQHNLAESRRQEVEDLRRQLLVFGEPAARRTTESADTRERLRSLGYVAAAGPGERTAPYGVDDDPKRLIHLETKLQQVVDAYLTGDLPGALARSRALVNERPDMRVALLQLAHLERESGQLAAGIAALRRAHAMNPRDPESAALLGAYLTAARRPGEAIELLEPHAAEGEPDPQVHSTLALAYAAAGRHGDALALLDQARKRDPSNVMIQVHAGTVHLAAGERDAARRAFEAALASNPAAARAHSSLAAMATEEGRQTEALARWREAVALDPGEHEKLLAMAITLARAGRVDEARPYMQLFAESAPTQRFADDIARARSWLQAHP